MYVFFAHPLGEYIEKIAICFFFCGKEGKVAQ
jgi:hypothetical protein